MTASPNSKSRKLRNKAIAKAKAKAWADERRKSKNATKSLEEVKKEKNKKKQAFLLDEEFEQIERETEVLHKMLEQEEEECQSQQEICDTLQALFIKEKVKLSEHKSNIENLKRLLGV
jgi:hypothetical protein